MRELLSTREIVAFDLLIEGLSNKEIAEKMFIAEKTLKTHYIPSIFRKTGYPNRTKLIVAYYKNTAKGD